jgi:hypothetical protein
VGNGFRWLPLDDLEAQGRKTFTGFCATCHGGPTQTKNADARFLNVPQRGPLVSGPQEFVNIFVSTPRPPPPGPPPPLSTPAFFAGLPTAGLDNVGFTITLPSIATLAAVSSDPGRLLITGDAREFFDLQAGFFAPEANGQGCNAGQCRFRPMTDAEVAGLKAYLRKAGT